MKMNLQTLLLSLLLVVLPSVGCVQKKDLPTSGTKLSLDKWTYIQVDSTRDGYVIPGGQPWWNYFGLDLHDINSDGLPDIIAGDWYYRNPGGDLSMTWERIAFPIEVDAVLTLDADGDEFADVIGLQLPAVFWLEAKDKEGKEWSYVEIGKMKQTGLGIRRNIRWRRLFRAAVLKFF